MRKPKTFTDRLDEFLEGATEDEVCGLIASIRIWARVKKLPFKIEVKEIAAKEPEPAKTATE